MATKELDKTLAQFTVNGYNKLFISATDKNAVREDN